MSIIFFLNLKQAQFESQLFHLWSKYSSFKNFTIFFSFVKVGVKIIVAIEGQSMITLIFLLH